jgi:hypothetical protein
MDVFVASTNTDMAVNALSNLGLRWSNAVVSLYVVRDLYCNILDLLLVVSLLELVLLYGARQRLQ